MVPFALHPRLAADTHRLGRLGAHEVLLHRDAALPWFIVVPHTDRIGLFDLEVAARDAAMAHCDAIARFIREDLGWPRINFGAIGNLVPQLHLHVIGRREGDVCWPAPVWGRAGEPVAWEEGAPAGIAKRLASAIGLEVST